MLFLLEQRVHIGINNQASETTRHGVLWVTTDVDGVPKELRVPVIIDKPHLVAGGLNFATWRRVKRQIEKMGLKATHLELDFTKDKKIEGGGHYCYLLNSYKELLVSGNKGRPLYQQGYA